MYNWCMLIAGLTLRMKKWDINSKGFVGAVIRSFEYFRSVVQLSSLLDTKAIWLLLDYHVNAIRALGPNDILSQWEVHYCPFSCKAFLENSGNHSISWYFVIMHHFLEASTVNQLSHRYSFPVFKMVETGNTTINTFMWLLQYNNWAERIYLA